MATDPVSAPDLNASKWIYGFFIGLLTVIIRVINPAYPEGVMLAILLMNVFAPLIDYYVAEHKVKREFQMLSNRPFVFAAGLCVICSFCLTFAATSLKPMQMKTKPLISKKIY